MTMASIKFLIQSTSTSAPIYARLSLSRTQIFKRKTGLYVDAKAWSKKTGFPIAKDDNGKKLKNQLKDLEADLLKRVNKHHAEGATIDGDWLLLSIDIFFKRISENNQQSELLLDAIQTFIDSAPLRQNSKGSTGLSKSRIQGIKRLKSLVSEFLGRKKNSFKVSEVDISFSKKFSTWLHHDQGFATSYTLKMIDNIKTVCNDAEVNGIEVSSQLKKVKGGKIKNEVILYLSPEEQEKILSVHLKSEALKNARKWLILGCHIGQRGGDLLELTEKNLTTFNNEPVLELTQKKTGKHVHIPLDQQAKKIIDSGFPRAISMQKFNEYIKLICKEAEINEVVKVGKICMVPKDEGSDVKVKRKVVEEYQKWEVVASHICRRSFATNLHGKLAPPYIMSITGHSSEKEYLKYIGKTSGDYVSSIAAFFQQQDKETKNKPQFKIIRNEAVNQ